METGAGAAGGLVGSITIPQTLVVPSLSDSLNTGSVVGNTTAGGLAGKLIGGHVRGCASTGMVTVVIAAGGLVGDMACVASCATILTDCYATGPVVGNTYAGGLFGSLSESTVYKDSRIARCYTTGIVKADLYAGGVAGHLYMSKEFNLSDIAALNPRVTNEDSASFIGKFLGDLQRQSAWERCYVFKDMTLTEGASQTKSSGVE